MLLPYTGLWADLIEFPDGGNVIVTSGSCTLIYGAIDSNLLPINDKLYAECQYANDYQTPEWESFYVKSFYILNNG